MTKTDNKVTNILCYTASVFLPGILLIVAYNRNSAGNLLIFRHVLVLAGILAAAGLLLFIVFKKVTGSAEGALLVSGVYWLLFWLHGRIFTMVTGLIPAFPEALLTVLSAVIAVAAALFLRRFKPPLSGFRPAFNVLAVCLAGLFIINMIPAVSHEFRLCSARAEMSGMEESLRPYRIKRDFYVDPHLERPDIYWFHVDGMMSIETAERFFGEDFGGFREDIDSRGFVRLEDPILNAGFTYASLAAMLSPEFYDSRFGEILDEHEGELKREKGAAVYDELAKAGLTFHEDIAPDYEMPRAFAAAGYDVTVYNMGAHMPWESGADTGTRSVSEGLQGMYDSFISSDLPELLSMTTPLRFAVKDEPDGAGAYDAVVQALGDEGAPQLVYIGLTDAHMSNVWRFDTTLKGYDPTAVHAYPAAYRALAEHLLSLVDTVQARDPGAVIVIQSDHGFHVETTQDFLLEQGYSEEQVLGLMYSVFSAVYIPQQHGGPEAPIIPVNISRELVNRFVGLNYIILC